MSSSPLQLTHTDGTLVAEMTPEMRASLAGIRESARAIANLTEQEFLYSTVFQQQINAVTDALVRDGTMLRETVDTPMGAARKLTRQPILPAEFSRAHIYNQARVGTMINTQLQAGLRAIRSLLRGAEKAMQDDNVQVAFVCYRCCIEQVGHLATVGKQLGAVSVSSSFDDCCRALTDSYELMAKKLYATRVSWMGVARDQNLDELIRKDKIAYEENPDRINTEAASCLKGVDLLDKKVKGTRAIYNILCEFMHPNVGNLILSTTAASPREDSQGVWWVDKVLSSSGTPVFFKEMPRLAEWVFRVVELVLQELKLNIIPDIEAAEERMREAAQVFTKKMVKRNRKLLDPYGPCPCGSGKKLRFCCGKA